MQFANDVSPDCSNKVLLFQKLRELCQKSAEIFEALEFIRYILRPFSSLLWIVWTFISGSWSFYPDVLLINRNICFLYSCSTTEKFFEINRLKHSLEIIRAAWALCYEKISEIIQSQLALIFEGLTEKKPQFLSNSASFAIIIDFWLQYYTFEYFTYWWRWKQRYERSLRIFHLRCHWSISDEVSIIGDKCSASKEFLR